ncbi:MAG: hypothetical protein E7353_02720 [Clostridiales bacterium]|nr:hypothetical protein [Clostridiales bacterium]
MKKFAKVMALMLCVALLVCGGIFGTMAYLTSQTGTLTNTFSVGDVGIILTEGFVGTNGLHESKNGVVERVNYGQGFKLIPGAYYDKDPIIRVEDNSENAYLYVKVVNEIAPLEAGYVDETLDVNENDKCPTVATQMEANGWKPLYIDSNDNGELEASERVANVYFYAKDTSEGDLTVANQTYTVFTKVYISNQITDFLAHVDTKNPGSTAVNYKGKTIAVTAFAIQAQGFNSAAHAWEVASSAFTA